MFSVMKYQPEKELFLEELQSAAGLLYFKRFSMSFMLEAT